MKNAKITIGLIGLLLIGLVSVRKGLKSKIKKTNTSGSRLNLTTTANVPSKKKPN